MRTRRAAYLGLGIIGVVVAAMTLVRVVATEPAPRADGRATTRAAPAVEQIAALQREVDLLKAKVNHPPAVVVPEPAPSPGASDAPADREDSRRPTPAAPAQIAAMLEAHHASEPMDRAWSDDMRATLAAALDAHRTTVSSAQCAVSLCKVTLVHEDLDAQRQLAPTAAGLPALRAGAFYSYQDTETPPRTVLYVVREGHDIREIVAAQ